MAKDKKKHEILEVLAGTGINLAGVVGGWALPIVIAYYALGQPHDMYHALWEAFGDFRDVFMIGASASASAAGFRGALYLNERLFE